MSIIDCKKLIPNELIIKSADNQLYNSGIFMNVRPGVKRSSIHNPYFLTFILILCLISNIIRIAVGKENYTTINLVLGDWSAMFGMKYHYKFVVILITFMNIILESIHYYNYRMGIEPTYLSVFEMMSGLVTPHSIGLNDEKVFMNY